MKLYLNHTERYPVEQLQMQLFASEPSEFVTAPFAEGENGAVSNLFTGNTYVTATAKITWNGKTGSAAKRLLREQADVRHTRRILQQSYYLAAMQVLDAVPPWGALSGVRPSKLSTKALLAGKTRRQAERELEREFFVTPERAKLCVDASEHTVEAIGSAGPARSVRLHRHPLLSDALCLLLVRERVGGAVRRVFAAVSGLSAA